MTIKDMRTIFIIVLAVSAGLSGGVIYAVRETSLTGIEKEIAVIKTDVAWIKSTLTKLESSK